MSCIARARFAPPTYPHRAQRISKRGENRGHLTPPAKWRVLKNLGVQRISSCGLARWLQRL